MPSPKKVQPTNPNVPIAADTAAKLKAAQQSQGGSTIGQENAVNELNYTTEVDPITGMLKYKANVNYTPGQQAIFDLLQGNKIDVGSTASDAIANMFSQYTTDPNFVGGANSLTNEALDSMMPAWERFDAPARDQLRTQLINQGLQEGSPAYQQQMDKLTQQQDLDRGQWMAGFQPQAFEEVQKQYQTPLANVMAMLGIGNPEALGSGFVNTPGLNVGSADVMGAYGLAQDAQKFNAQQENAYWNNIIGGGTNLASAYLGIPKKPA